MKNFKFKSLSSMQRYAATLLVFLTLFSTHAWATDWYSHNNASTIYFNDYTTNWVSDPSSNGIAFLMGRDQTYTNAGVGSQSYRMTHIAHTMLWYCDVPKWGDDMSEGSMYQFIAFRFVSGTTGWNDWQGGWDNRVTGRAQYGSNTQYSCTYNHNITGRAQFYTPSSSSSNTAMTACNNCFDSEKKFTAYLRVNIDEEADGTYDGVRTGEATWPYGVTFDFTGTYMNSGNKTSGQSTIYGLEKNYWLVDKTKTWGYGGVPITGEVTFELKTIDTGFEITGWAYSESATSPAYTDNLTNPTFQVLGNTSYVAFIRRKSYTVTLNDNGGSGGSGSKTVKYDRSSNMTSNVTKPTMLGYTFQGYYTNDNGTGSQIIDKDGAWVKDVTNYTGTDGSGDAKWVRDESVELFAKWTQDITLDRESGTTGSTSVTATYNSTTLGSFTNPERTGYTFGGYYSGDNGTNQLIINTSKELQANKTDGSAYTGTGGKWIHAGATTLYAKWTANNYDLTFDDEGATTAGGNSKRTVTYDASTNLGSASLPQKEGYTFNGYWTTASGDGLQIFAANGSLQSTVSGYITSGKWTHDGNVELHARWNDDGTYYFSGNDGASTAWATAANWTKGAVPGSSSNVILLKPVVVPANATNTVNSVKIATEGSYTPNGGSAITAAGKLTIEPKGMLIVTNAVQNCVITNNAAASASSTTAATLHIESGAAGNGALVWGTSGTPGKAQVDFYTISGGSKDANTSINQYIGTPFSDESNYYNYYNAWTFKVNAAGTAWERLPMGTGMDPFVGYNIIYNGNAGHCFEMEGTLVSNADVELTAPSAVENVLANSWMAPIKIANFEEDDFDGVNATIYIFNSTSQSSYSGWGNYSSITVNQADGEVIPSMQSFSVVGGADGTISLNYEQLVKDGASASSISPNKAPRKDASRRETIWASQDILQLFVHGANGWMDELKYYIHEEFSNAFENGWDGRKLYGYSEAPQLYAVTEDGNMAINCVPSVENNVIGFHAGTANNEYTFTFAYSGDEELYLKDTKLNIETLINTEATYTFTSEAEDSDMRFIIIKRAPAVATDAETVSGDRLAVSGVQKIMHNGQLYIIRDGGIYSTDGQMVK